MEDGHRLEQLHEQTGVVPDTEYPMRLPVPTPAGTLKEAESPSGPFVI